MGPRLMKNRCSSPLPTSWVKRPDGVTSDVNKLSRPLASIFHCTKPDENSFELDVTSSVDDLNKDFMKIVQIY